MPWISDALIGWGSFWTTYYAISLFFDFRYKTAKYITGEDIFRNIFQNMWYTGIFQLVFVLLLPHGLFDPQYVIYRFLISIVITEFLFFYVHKWMHHKSMYKYHEKHHLFIEPCAFAALYCSPIEMVLCNQLSTVVGPIITGMGVWENVVWSIFCALNVLKAHSGSRLHFFNSRYHDLHHSKRVVNFGFLYLLDILHGTCELPLINNDQKIGRIENYQNCILMPRKKKGLLQKRHDEKIQKWAEKMRSAVKEKEKREEWQEKTVGALETSNS